MKHSLFSFCLCVIICALSFVTCTSEEFPGQNAPFQDTVKTRIQLSNSADTLILGSEITLSFTLPQNVLTIDSQSFKVNRIIAQHPVSVRIYKLDTSKISDLNPYSKGLFINNTETGKASFSFLMTHTKRTQTITFKPQETGTYVLEVPEAGYLVWKSEEGKVAARFFSLFETLDTHDDLLQLSPRLTDTAAVRFARGLGFYSVYVK